MPSRCACSSSGLRPGLYRTTVIADAVTLSGRVVALPLLVTSYRETGSPSWDSVGATRRVRKPRAARSSALRRAAPPVLVDYYTYPFEAAAPRLCSGLLAEDNIVPASSNASFRRGSLPTREARNALSTVTIWETLATESLGNPVRRAENSTFLGAEAHVRFVVKGTQTTVEMRLRFRASP